MPIFLWVDKNTDYSIEIIRGFSEFESPPSDDELPEAEKGKVRDWERRISKLAFVQKGESWGPGKGRW